MSVTRSPPTATGGGSQPDLSKLHGDVSGSQITFRSKRKQPADQECQCSEDIKLIRSELTRITTLLETYVTTNSQMMTQTNDYIGTIKTEISGLKVSHDEIKKSFENNLTKITSEIQNIKSSTSIISFEHNNIKSQLNQLETKLSIDNKKIELLEKNIKELKISPSSSNQNSDMLYTNEKLIHEVQERKRRENNIIIMGIAEEDTCPGHFEDDTKVHKLLEQIVTNIPKPKNIFRIGRYIPGKTRKVKVCFEKPETALLILKNRNKFPTNIKIFSDQTPAQHKYYALIKNELNKRISSGETDITIKYVNGTPTIVKSPTKNFNQ